MAKKKCGGGMTNIVIGLVLGGVVMFFMKDSIQGMFGRFGASTSGAARANAIARTRRAKARAYRVAMDTYGRTSEGYFRY